MANAIPRFKCPVCNEYIQAIVKYSEPRTEGVRRRRECEACGARFITMETITRMARNNKSKSR